MNTPTRHIVFHCTNPDCNSELKAPVLRRGRRARCPKCGSLVVIPASSPPTTAECPASAEGHADADLEAFLGSLDKAQQNPDAHGSSVVTLSNHSVSAKGNRRASPGEMPLSQRIWQGIGSALALFAILWVFCLTNFWPLLLGLAAPSGKSPTDLPVSKYANSISSFALSGWALVGLAIFLAVGLMAAFSSSPLDEERQRDGS